MLLFFTLLPQMAENSSSFERMGVVIIFLKTGNDYAVLTLLHSVLTLKILIFSFLSTRLSFCVNVCLLWVSGALTDLKNGLVFCCSFLIRLSPVSTHPSNYQSTCLPAGICPSPPRFVAIHCRQDKHDTLTSAPLETFQVKLFHLKCLGSQNATVSV